MENWKKVKNGVLMCGRCGANLETPITERRLVTQFHCFEHPDLKQQLNNYSECECCSSYFKLNFFSN